MLLFVLDKMSISNSNLMNIKRDNFQSNQNRMALVYSGFFCFVLDERVYVFIIRDYQRDV